MITIEKPVAVPCVRLERDLASLTSPTPLLVGRPGAATGSLFLVGGAS